MASCCFIHMYSIHSHSWSQINKTWNLEFGVLCNGQQAGSSSIDEGEFETMKTLSGHIAPRCDKHQFCGKMTVST